MHILILERGSIYALEDKYVTTNAYRAMKEHYPEVQGADVLDFKYLNDNGYQKFIQKVVQMK